MATGITKNEKFGPDALTAMRPRRDLFPLPAEGVAVRLEYGGKLPEEKILEQADVEFSSVSINGKTNKISAITPNSFVLSDNYFGLHGLIGSGKKATLIYLDPPYGTGMDFQSRKQEHAYNDSMCPATYVEFIRRRLVLMRELLTDDGSIYIHIGHQMLAHLKLVMDEIFGVQNFRNIIVRRKCSSKNFTRNQYANLNDYILLYTKSASYKWNRPGMLADEDWIDKEYPKVDAKGRYKLVPIHAPGTRRGESGLPWRGMTPPLGKHWQYLPSKLEEMDKQGDMHWSRNGNPRRKVYLEKGKLITMTDYWDRFRDAHHQSILVTGYPTEKNLDMLKLIVSASSCEGDLVVDPFCGSGTTMHAANDLQRKWIGIDQSFSAAKATLTRFRHGLEPMGDYVNKTKSVRHQADLFENLSKSSGKFKTSKTNFSFVVDAALMDSFHDEIIELGKI